MNASLFDNRKSIRNKISDPDIMKSGAPEKEFGLFDSVFHEVNNAIAIISRETESQPPLICDINHHFELISGYQLDEIRGKSLYDFLEEISSNPTRLFIETALNSRQAAVLCCPWVGKKGNILDIDMTIRPFSCDNSGSRFICVLRENRSEKDNRSRAAKEVKQNLLAAMHHDFKTPLNGILGYSEFIMSELHGPIGQESYKNYVQDIYGAGKHLLHLIDNLLDLKELETAEFALQEEKFSPKDMLSACLDKLPKEAGKAQINFTCQGGHETPYVFGDKSRLQQAIHRILANALKFTPASGTITLSARQESDGAYLISCADNGAGMSSQQLAKIFCHDTHLSDIYTTPGVGMGFGLSYVKQIVEKHGGTVSITSAEGKGTTVALYIPAARLG